MAGISWAPPPNPSPWNQVPAGIDSLVQGVSAIREKVQLPKDFELLGQSQAELQSGTANYPELISKMKTATGRNLVAGIWQKQLEAAANVTSIYNPEAPPGQQLTTIRGAKNVKVAPASEASKQKGRIELEEMREKTRMQIADLQDKRQQRSLDAAETRQLRSLEAMESRFERALAQKEKSGSSTEDIQEVISGVMRGDIAPDQLSKRNTKGEYTKILAGVQREGGSLTKLNLQYQAGKRHVASMNGPQMVRFKGLAGSVVNTIDEVRELSKQMQMSGVTALNKVELESYAKLRGNTPGGQLAIRYLAAANTLKEEFANLAMGGYAPTEPAFALANKQINENYGVKGMDASLSEVQRLINYRINAFDELEPSMSGTGARGSGRGQQSPAGKTRFESMPSANKYKGQILDDDKTGKSYRSDGSKWTEIKE